MIGRNAQTERVQLPGAMGTGDAENSAHLRVLVAIRQHIQHCTERHWHMRLHRHGCRAIRNFCSILSGDIECSGIRPRRRIGQRRDSVEVNSGDVVDGGHEDFYVVAGNLGLVIVWVGARVAVVGDGHRDAV